MPMQLALGVLAYFAALALPGNYKRFFHPVLVSSVVTILGIWVLYLVVMTFYVMDCPHILQKTRYLQLWDCQEGLQRPGAGDVFSSVLDMSIVALALPLLQYRNKSKRHVSANILESSSSKENALEYSDTGRRRVKISCSLQLREPVDNSTTKAVCRNPWCGTCRPLWRLVFTR